MKFTTFSLAAVAACTLTAFASADVIMDHIGAMDGSDLAGSVGASQDFDADGDYDIVAADVFTMDTAMNLSTASTKWSRLCARLRVCSSGFIS